MKKYLLYILSAIVLVSCAREWLPDETPVEEALIERTFTVVMDDATRAFLNEGLSPVWEVGEELSVYDHVSKVGRIFRVESVDGVHATITGSISAGGDIPFDAIYPAKSAGEWSSDATSTLKLPEVQYIPEGRNVCPDVLVSTAHSEDHDAGITFHNISSLLKVNLEREGISEISIELTGSTTSDIHGYKAEADASSGTFATGTYYIAVDPGTYKRGVKVTCFEPFGQGYRKSSTKSLEAGVGGILNLGTVSDGDPWRYYNVTGEKHYTNQQALMDETGLNVGSYQSMLSLIFPDRNKPATALSYTYYSADPAGYPVELSAVLYITDAALSGSKKLTGISLTNHGTYASNAECPTMKSQFEGALAWKNYALVMPDYYGFGASADRPQAYLDPETTARGNIDAYLAACQLLKDRNVKIPDKLYSFGYSQGGFNSMANLRYVSLHPELGISFKKVMCGGSPFDVPLTWKAFTGGSFPNAIPLVPLAVVSINETQQLHIDYNNLFKGRLLVNWQEWILSKTYTISQINQLLGATSLSDIMNDSFMNGELQSSPSYDAIMDVCRRYSLTSGWTPPSGTNLYLFHSKDDDTVPYENLTAMKSYLDNVAPGCYTLSDGNYGGHTDAVVNYVLSVIYEW
ncbi:MAG: hypothetical protein J5495_02585 [Bacteroidales bacterium]|nr:hypothetical protein [Bacteroidales bacterium]